MQVFRCATLVRNILQKEKLMANPIVPLVFGLFMAVVIGTYIGGILLRAGVSLFNKMAGESAAVLEPSKDRAMAIVFLTFVTNSIVGFIIGFLYGIAFPAIPAVVGAKAAGPNINMTVQFISLPVGFLVTAGIIAFLLPVNFGKSILIALCYYLITLSIVGMIAGLCMLVL